MAKKLVKYAYCTPERYNSILKKDEYTVYFVYNTIIDSNGKEVPGQYGTIYKGNTRIGSAIANDIVFDKKLVVTVLQGATEEDSVYYTIEPGTSLTQFVEGLIQQTAAWDEKLYSDFVGDGTPANPGIIYATIEQETTADDGVISNEINSRIADSIDKDGVISSYLEANYVSNDSLGRIEELSKILDASTLDTLINAAAGIQEVLDNYYTKEEAENLLKDVIIADTSAGFPEAGNSEKLYVSADDNYMYRWGKYDPEDETEGYVMVSGGGGGSADVKIETHVYIKNAATSVSIAKDTDFTAEYAFSSANTYTTYHPVKGFQVVQQQIGNIGTVKYYLDGIQIGSGQCAQANYYQEDDSKNKYNEYTIPRAKFTGTRHTLKIVASDINGNTAEESITINIVNVVITSSFAGNPSSLAQPLSVPVTVASSGSVDIFYKVDDDPEVLALTVKSGVGTNNISIPNVTPSGATRTHGTHNIKVWASTFIAESATKIVTSPIEWEIIWYDPLNSVPIVSFICTDEKHPDGTYKATQYEYASFVYQVYPSSDIQLISSKEGVETVIKDLKKVDITAQKWSYIFDEPGTYTLYAKIKYDNSGEEAFLTSEQFTIEVAKSEHTMDPVEGAMFYMTARNHDNNSSHAWTSEIHTDPDLRPLAPIDASLIDFAWNDNSGWHTEGATTSLRVGGGARCKIPFNPFYYNLAQGGMTFEIDFSTSNLSNSNAEVIRCYSERDKKGIVVTATGVYWETPDWANTEADDTRIHVPFKEEQRIRLSFVLTPTAADDTGAHERVLDIWNESTKSYEKVDTVAKGWWKFLKIYVNGICTSVDSYTQDGGLTVTDDVEIVIGSDEATVDIYNIRMYPTAFYDKQVIANYIADTQDPAEKLSIFKRNNVLDDMGVQIDYIKLNTMLPCLYVTCDSTSSYKGFTNKDHILPMNKKDKRGYIAVYNCEAMSDEYKAKFPWAKSFIAFNAQMCVQGTSSQYYPRKNYKLTFKPDKKVPKTEEAYRKAVESKKPTLLYVGTTGTAYNNTDLESWVKSNVLNEETQKLYSKNYKLRDFDESVEKTDIEHISSINATKYCLKADFMESSSTHNTGVAKYVDFLLKGIGEEYLTPPQLGQFRMSDKLGTARMNDVDIRTTVDGYPCAVFWRRSVEDDSYTFLGKYNFNHDKGAESVFGFIDLPDGLINPYTGYEFSQFNEDYVDNAAPADRSKYESPVECWEFTNNTTNLCKFKYLHENSFTATTKNEDGDIVPEWIESFEARHPDNDTLIGDMEGGSWVPTHWHNFLSWVSSTDTYGYLDPVTKLYRIPYKWEGTLDELRKGSAETKSFISIVATLEELNEGRHDTYQSCIQSDGKGGYIDAILEPETLNMDGDMTADTSYKYYGYIVSWNQDSDLWEIKEKYVPKETEVDTKKAYYIAKAGDVDYNRVFTYDSKNGSWNQLEVEGKMVTLEDYRLPSKVTYNGVDYFYDNAEYRLKKFYYELKDHMRVKFTIAYYVLSEFFNCIDQRAKNMMFATWGYEPESLDEVKAPSYFSSEAVASKAGYKPVYNYSLVEQPVEGFVINKAYVVKDEASYNLLPESYRAKYGEWGVAGLEESLPWLAAEFDAIPAKNLAIKVEGPNDFVKEISYPEVENEASLLTLNAEELGTTLVNGTWSITINGYTAVIEKNDEPSVVVEGKPKTITVTVKTPLYYVPNKYNYKYYPIFYDNDSVLGLNNTGYLMYGPNTESTDTVGSGYAFNGADSVLWVNLATEFNKEIAEVYTLLRKNGLTYDKALYYFNDSQSSAWSESVYNMDSKFKYIEPATIGYIDFSKKDNEGNAGVNVQDSYYLFECQGSRATHRSWWLNNRLTYMDSRYDCGEYHDSFALFRVYTNLADGTYNKVVEPDPTFYLTPYTDMYLRIKFGSRYGVVRANKNVTYMVNSGTDDKYNDTETMVYGASNILSYGDLTAKYVKLCNVGPSSRITDLILGHDAPYFNDNLTNLSFNPSNTALKKVDVRNCRKLNTLTNLNNLTSIEEFLASNTALNTIDFSTNGANLKKVAFPESLSALKLVNMPYISNSGITFGGFKKLQSIWIERCEKMDTWAITSNVLSSTNNILSNIRLTDVDWEITTTGEFGLWTKFLALRGMDELGSSNRYSVPYVTGKVKLGGNIEISTGYKQGVQDLIRNNANGAKLVITGGKEVPMNGITISGPTVITPGTVYKYEISYAPDNFVVDEQKGVKWTLPSGLVMHNQTNDYVELSFEGSASGKESFELIATSLYDSSKVSSITIRPGATLERIRLFNVEGNEISKDGIELYEGSQVTINVQFTPDDTKDTDVKIDVTSPENFVLVGDSPYEYSEKTRNITLTGADVSSTKSSILTVTSTKVPSVSAAIPIYVKNIVSRILYLVDETDGLSKPVQGYAEVYVAGNDNPYTVFSDKNGVIKMPTNVYDPENGAFGLEAIKVEAHTNNEAEMRYSRPAPIEFSALPEGVIADIEQTAEFFEPIECHITVINGNKPIDDAYLMISSIQNSTTHNTTMVEPPYNNVHITPATKDETGNVITNGINPVTIKLLANTTHTISIVQTEGKTTSIAKPKVYSDFSGTITTGTGRAIQEVSINIARDYLGDITDVVDATELRMRVVTGDAETASNNKTVRVYYKTVAPITVYWGDGKSDTLNTATEENIAYHKYENNNTEYSISVKAETDKIRWFHVISESDGSMKPCMGTGNTSTDFETSNWTADKGGLVAYQSCGAAKFATAPRFNFGSQSNSRLLCVGNIYKGIKDMTSANGLFKNSTLEQIPSKPLFSNNTEITTFESCFENTNITALPAAFFANNKRATNYKGLCRNCKYLSTINTEEDIQFLFMDSDIEINEIDEMFKGCSALVSEVPALWKEFYGCSFMEGRRTNAFADCPNIANLYNVPESWGGKGKEYSYTVKPLDLKYIEVQWGSNDGTSYGTFELSNIAIKGNYKYVFDITVSPKQNGKPYELIPFFGGAYASNPTDLNTIESVIDFTWSGSKGYAKPGNYEAYLCYRNGDETLIDNLKSAIGGSGNYNNDGLYPDAKNFDKTSSFRFPQGNAGQQYETDEHGNSWGPGIRVRFDICYTEEKVITITQPDNPSIPAMKAYIDHLWKADSEWTANIPLKIFSSYAVGLEYNTRIDGDNLGNYTGGAAPGTYRFHGLKIYDRSGTLKHDIVPVYAVVGGVSQAVLRDNVATTDNIYCYEGKDGRSSAPIAYYRAQK